MTRFGVCGTAFWAENVHIPGLQANPDIELVGIWGRNASHSAELAAATGVEAFQSFEQMVDSVEAISFVVPPAVQSELAPLAIRRGKHVLLEKPLGDTSESALRIMRAIEENGVAGLCFLTRMFVGQVSDFVEGARAILPASGEASFRSDALLGGPYSGSLWRQQEHGAIWDAAPHGMSVLVSVLGEIAEVAAKASVDGGYAFTFRHAAGGTSSLDLNLRDPSVKLAERYLFANGKTVELPELAYNRKETFSYAAGLLLEEIAGAHSESRSRIKLGMHLVCVAEAAQQSLSRGCDFMPVSTPKI